MVTAPYSWPWYDDRVTALKSPDQPFDQPEGDEDAQTPAPEDSGPDNPLCWSPKKIYEYLDERVWKQDAAKQAAAMLAYNTLGRGIKENAFFVGPTGCGKTHIWRCLQELYPRRIAIVDASHLTQDGWTGGTKWADLLRDPIFCTPGPAILVMDEADKFLMPHYSHGENVSQAIASEGLKILEGTLVELKKPRSTVVDTSRISFVCCGAFSVKAQQIAKSQQKIGFGGATAPAAAYDQPITEKDLLDYGVMPEFMGRIQRVVNLEPMTAEDYFRMLDSTSGPVNRLQSRYKVEIHLTEQTRRDLADLAADKGLGVRGMENQLRRLMDSALFENPGQSSLEL